VIARWEYGEQRGKVNEQSPVLDQVDGWPAEGVVQYGTQLDVVMQCARLVVETARRVVSEPWVFLSMRPRLGDDQKIL
jgi:hypothetical protein